MPASYPAAPRPRRRSGAAARRWQTASMPDPGVLLVAELHGLAGRESELRALLAELATSARGESGCVSFRVLASEDPGEVVLLAGWRDEPALRAHYDTAGYRRYRGEVGPLLARPSDVVVHHVGGGGAAPRGPRPGPPAPPPAGGPRRPRAPPRPARGLPGGGAPPSPAPRPPPPRAAPHGVDPRVPLGVPPAPRALPPAAGIPP